MPVFSYRTSGNNSSALTGVIVAPSEREARGLLSDRFNLHVQTLTTDGTGHYRIVIDVLCCVMAADGTASRLEKKHICDAMEGLSTPYPREVTVTAIKSFVQLMKQCGYSRMFELTIHNARELGLLGTHEHLLHALSGVAESDREFTQRERKVIGRFTALGDSSCNSQPTRHPNATLYLAVRGIGIFVAIISLYLLTFEGVSKVLVGRASTSWPSVPGQVVVSRVDKYRSSGNNGPSSVPVIEYRYSVDGAVYTNNRIAAYRLPGYRAQTMDQEFPLGPSTVYYNPASPSEAVLITGTDVKLYSDILITTLGLLVGLSIFIGAGRHRSRTLQREPI